MSFEPLNIMLRLSPRAPQDLPLQLTQLLKKKRNEAWTIAISGEIGQPTIYEKEQQRQQERREAILQEPLVKMVVEAFPGTTLAPLSSSG